VSSNCERWGAWGEQALPPHKTRERGGSRRSRHTRLESVGGAGAPATQDSRAWGEQALPPHKTSQRGNQKTVSRLRGRSTTALPTSATVQRMLGAQGSGPFSIATRSSWETRRFLTSRQARTVAQIFRETSGCRTQHDFV
jgi:hypothetical protein